MDGAVPITGDYRIDALLQDIGMRWNADAPLGTPAAITYSFMTAKPLYGGTDADGAFGFTPFSTVQQAAVREVFRRLSQEVGLDFQEVTDDASSYGQIRFGNNSQWSSLGYSWLPYSAGDDRDGDVWLDGDTIYNLSPTPGSDGWAVLVHEIGHALGLKHPGNYNAGEAPSTGPGNYLTGAEDNVNFTIMSYQDALGGQPREWFGMYDLLALKTVYGARALHAGDTLHRFTDSQGAVLGVVTDASGHDTLDFSALSIGVTLDLRPGSFSSVGRNGASPAIRNLSIDLATTVEDVLGTAHGDIIAGNDVDNAFALGLGYNRADGRGGLDRAVYEQPASAFTVAASAGTVTVSASGRSDTLTSVERLVFTDRKLAFDLEGNAGWVARIIGAVFGKSMLSPEYAGIGLSLLDAGMTPLETAQFALTARLGANPSHAAVVDTLYRNVMNHAPSADELAYYVGLLDTGMTEPALGLLAAQTPQTAATIDLVGLAATGLAYL